NPHPPDVVRGLDIGGDRKIRRVAIGEGGAHGFRRRGEAIAGAHRQIDGAAGKGEQATAPAVAAEGPGIGALSAGREPSPAPSFRRQSALLRLHETKGARAWIRGLRARGCDARLGAVARATFLLVAVLPARAAEAPEGPPSQAEDPGR